MPNFRRSAQRGKRLLGGGDDRGPRPSAPSLIPIRLCRSWLAQGMAVLLVVMQVQAAEQATASPQAPAAPASATPAVPPNQAQPVSQLPIEQSLKIRVLAGNDEMNDLERKVMAPLVVQVVDQNENAIEGAEVIFRFPINGPSATFPGNKPTVTVRTNGTGQAAAVNWMANGQAGTFQVHVNASYGNQIGETTVSMTNVTRIEENTRRTTSRNESSTNRNEHLWSHWWFKAAVIGGAAAIGIGVYLGTRGGGHSTSTVTISPGSPGVGGPQ